MLMPLFTAESEIEPVYVAAVSVAEVAFTVKVALPPVATVALAGETANQLLPDARVTVGVMVTSPTQAPMMPTVKVCAAGSDPASALKVSPLEEGVCIVHGGCTVSVIVIFCAAPAGWCVLSSTAEMLTVPVYVLADRPASAMPTCVAAESSLVTLPDADVVVSQEPPEAVVTVAVQSSACLQAPVALMVTPCAAGFACPMAPEKVSAAGETETAQAAWTLKLTGICCGLPSAGCPDASEPVIVTVPL